MWFSHSHQQVHHNYMSNEVHRKTDSPFAGNNMTVTVAEPEPLTIRSGGLLASSNHYATLEESIIIV